MRQHDEVDSRRVRRSVATELSEDLAFLKHLIYVNNHYALASSNEKALSGFLTGLRLKTAASYFPTWYRSIIGASELNFSVRNGLRWILTAITALFLSTGRISLLSAVYLMRKTTWYLLAYCLALLGALSFCSSKLSLFLCFSCHFTLLSSCFRTREALGLLVPLGFDIAAFTPAAYLRGSLPRPSMEISSWSRLRA